MLRKTIDCQSLKIYQKDVCDGVYFVILLAYSVQIANLLLTEFTTNSFRNMFQKLVFLKRIFCEKVYGVTTASSNCALQFTARNFSKTGVHVRPFRGSAVKFKSIHNKNLFFSKVAGLESISLQFH